MRKVTQTLNKTSVEILNALNKDACNGQLPDIDAKGSTFGIDGPTSSVLGSIHAYGQMLETDFNLRNSWLNALMNRISAVIVQSRMYSNPWAMFKRGTLEYGEIIEEIFVNIAKVRNFDVNGAKNNFMDINDPEVLSRFHVINYRKQYPVTVREIELRQAFLSVDGVTDLIGRVVDSMFSAAEVDEFLTCKYLLARRALNGQIVSKTVGTSGTDEEKAKALGKALRADSDLLTFMGADYNNAGVFTYTPKEDQYLILSAQSEADLDIDLLASAFNIDKANFMGKRSPVNYFDFSPQELARLNQLFIGDADYTPLTQTELNKLKTITAMLVDVNWFMIFDNYTAMTENYNGSGMYWNYFYNVWKTVSSSDFANAVLYTTSTSAVSTVTVTPSEATVTKGQDIKLTAAVTTTGFASKEVLWEVNGTGNSYVTQGGVLHVAADEALDELTVTVTSLADESMSAEATITLV